MKITLVTALLLCAFTVSAQDYKSIVATADQHYNNKEYNESVARYQEAFKLNKTRGSDLYNAACSAALSGNKKLAFEWLNLALKNGWTNVRHLKSDSDLNSLHNTKKWNKLVAAMQKEVDKVEANYDKPLQEELLAIYEDDQGVRRVFVETQKQFGPKSPQSDSLIRIMKYKDSVNLVKVKAILDKHGWVGADKVGGQANQTLFLVIQHADLATQQQYLPMMREAVKSKKASGSDLALLEDRIALREGRKQLYGSQIGRDNDTGQFYVLPLEDPDNVDKRRAEVGLGPIADYVKRWNLEWDVEAYKKQLPEIEALENKKKQKH
ncbi:MAG: hypothetical protein HUU34_10835 [Saprospiraceae bacterium]|jgi:hypothetical protein|nr:hypothetical protein [Saprospiraceae bacterium]